VKYLRRHVQLNGASQISVHQVAVSDRIGTARFAPGTHRSTGRLEREGSIEVRSVSLDDFVFTEGHHAPDVITIDVEGAEVLVLSGALRIMREHRLVVFLSTHGAAVHRECCEMLEALGYHCCGLAGEPMDSTDELFCCPDSQ
jgi:FkbM family methyltransferase